MRFLTTFPFIPQGNGALTAVILLLLLLPVAATPLSAQSTAERDIPPRGSLVIIGGALHFDQPEVWNEIVRVSGGAGAKIAVLPAASSDPLRVGGRVVDMFNSLGARPFLVPVAVRRVDVDYRTAVRDAALVDEVRQADGIFFTGGAQSLITQVLFDDGTPTPLLEAIWGVYQRGGMIAGTSAGAAVMSRIMFKDPGTVMNTIQRGVRMGKEIDRGCGFLHPDWFVEQHCLARGRFARMLVAMQAAEFRYGVGVDEGTAIVVSADQSAHVVGKSGAVVIDISQSDFDAKSPGFNIRNARITYLDAGDTMNLATREVKPSYNKEQGEKITPVAFQAEHQRDDALIATDILSSAALVDVMSRLVRNQHGMAVGLAFAKQRAVPNRPVDDDNHANSISTDGKSVTDQPDRLRAEQATVDSREADSRIESSEHEEEGFEFRFYQDKDTVGWFTDKHYTVANVRLDVQPIGHAGQLSRDEVEGKTY